MNLLQTVDGGGSHKDSQENVAQGVLSGHNGTEGFNLHLSPAHHMFIVVSQLTEAKVSSSLGAGRT